MNCRVHMRQTQITGCVEQKDCNLRCEAPTIDIPVDML